VTLPAFAAARRAAAVQQSIDISHPPGPQQQTRSSGEWDIQTDGWTDGRTLDSCIYPAPHAMRAVSKVKKNCFSSVDKK